MQANFLASLGRILWRLLEAHRIDRVGLFERNGLDPSLLRESRARYPFERLCAAWVETATVTGNQNIGLEAVKFYSPLDLNALGVTFLSSSTLLEALLRMDRYESVLSSDLDFSIVETKDRVDFICAEPVFDSIARRILEDVRTSVVLDLSRTGLNHSLDPTEIAFTYPKPEDTGDYFGLFHCPLVFGQEQSRISFKLTDVQRPFADTSRELAIANDHILDSMMRDLKSSDLISRVKKAIIDALPSGAPGQSDIAELMFVSNRTLQRRLADEGTNFRTLLLEVRHELAERYISDRSLPLAEISYMLGFSDTSSFSRAFKRWTGSAPNESRIKSTA